MGRVAWKEGRGCPTSHTRAQQVGWGWVNGAAAEPAQPAAASTAAAALRLRSQLLWPDAAPVLRRVEALGMDAPDHSEIDSQDLAASFQRFYSK